jgi:hypothetical protein
MAGCPERWTVRRHRSSAALAARPVADASDVDVYGGDFFLEPRAASGGLLGSPASVARFLDRHNVYGLGGRPSGSGTRYGTFVGTSAGATSTTTPTGRWDFAWATNRDIADSGKDQLTNGINSHVSTCGASLITSPFDVDENFPIRGVLLLGGSRTQAELNAMSYEDMGNTVFVEMSKHSNQPVPWYQGQADATLAGMGAAMVFLRHTGIRDDAALRQMSADDQRNSLIVEMDGQTGQGRALQGFSTLGLVLIALGRHLGPPRPDGGSCVPTPRTRPPAPPAAAASPRSGRQAARRHRCGRVRPRRRRRGGQHPAGSGRRWRA